jgi:hypothetical protein
LDTEELKEWNNASHFYFNYMNQPVLDGWRGGQCLTAGECNLRDTNDELIA